MENKNENMKTLKRSEPENLSNIKFINLKK